MVAVKYTLKDLGVKRRIKKIGKNLANFRKPLKECGLVMVRSVSKTFKAGGRPVKWKPSWRAKAEGGKTLIKTARLMRSITMRVLGKILYVGTNVVYGRIHQLGGRIQENVTVKQHYRFITKAFGKPIEGRRVLVKSHQREVDIEMPARPFLVAQNVDLRVFRRIFTEHIAS